MRDLKPCPEIDSAAQQIPDPQHVATLQRRIQCLEQLVAELLLTNQRLRSQLASSPTLPLLTAL